MNQTIVKLGTYIVARLREPSTYVALTIIATGFGRTISHEQREAILTIGLIVAGMIGAVLPDRVGANSRSTDETLPPVKKDAP